MFKKSIILTIMLFFLASFAMADVTVSNKMPTRVGQFHALLADIAFDSSYNHEGESFDLRKYGFADDGVYQVHVFGKGGYDFDYDYGNRKVKVLAPAPPIVYEEKQELADTSSATGFTLDYPAAFIVSLVSSGGTAYPIIYSGETIMQRGAATLSAPIQDGVRTGVSVNPISWAVAGNTNFYVTYATQAWVDLYGLLVQNELMGIPGGTGVTRTTVSGNTIFGWGWAKQDGATTGVTPIDLADTAAAGEMGIDYGNNTASGATQAYCLVATGAQQYYCTYLKEPEGASWIHDRWINDENCTAGTSIFNLDRPLLLWLLSGYGTSDGDMSMQIVLEDQESFFSFPATSALITAGSGVSEMYTSWGYRGEASDAAAPDDDQVWSTYDGTGSVGSSLTHAVYLYGHPWEIQNLVPLQVKNGSDLSDLTGVKVMIIGR